MHSKKEKKKHAYEFFSNAPHWNRLGQTALIENNGKSPVCFLPARFKNAKNAVGVKRPQLLMNWGHSALKVAFFFCYCKSWAYFWNAYILQTREGEFHTWGPVTWKVSSAWIHVISKGSVPETCLNNRQHCKEKYTFFSNGNVSFAYTVLPGYKTGNKTKPKKIVLLWEVS